MKSFGYVKASPSDYIIVFKNGRIVKEGRGLRFFNTPSLQYVIIPACVNNITFTADQITKENQGVEVSGFTIWKVGEPSKIYMNFDFSPGKDPLKQVNTFLKEVVESAIRHMVANMTIEEVLRKRGTIILQLKKELEYISDQWGIVIETIEIKNVKVLSSKLFGNMQAKYRDDIRLESETSRLKTEKDIEEQKIQYAEKTAEMNQERLKIEIERKKQLKMLEFSNEQELKEIHREQRKNNQIMSLNDSFELFEKEEENKLKTIQTKTKTLLAEKELKEMELDTELFKKEFENKLKQMDLIIDKSRIEAENLRNDKLVLYENLPKILQSLKVEKINIGEDSILSIINKLKIFSNSQNKLDHNKENELLTK